MNQGDPPDDAGPPDRARPLHDDLPDGVADLGIPTPRSEHQAFVLSAAIVVALLALIFTLSWIVYHQLNPDAGPADKSSPTQSPN